MRSDEISIPSLETEIPLRHHVFQDDVFANICLMAIVTVNSDLNVMISFVPNRGKSYISEGFEQEFQL
jgi:hypothetical protein